MRQAQPVGQRMDQARARFRRAVESGEKAPESRAQGQRELRASAAGGDASPNGLAQANASLVSQRDPGQIIGSFDRTYRNMWNPEAKPPPDPLVHAIHESRALLQTSPSILSQEGGAAMEVGTGVEVDLELWDQDEGEAEEMADFEEVHAPGGRSRGRHARPRRNANLRRRRSRRREPQSRRRWRMGVLHCRRCSF